MEVFPKEKYTEEYDSQVFRDANDAAWHGALKKIPVKPTAYDEVLYTGIAAAKQHKAEVDKERRQRLCKPVPLPTDEEIEDIIKYLHTYVAESDESEFTDFYFYSMTADNDVELRTVSVARWLEPLMEWFKTTRYNNVLDPEDRRVLKTHALFGVEKFSQHICHEYNKRHAYSRATLIPGGFRIHI